MNNDHFKRNKNGHIMKINHVVQVFVLWHWAFPKARSRRKGDETCQANTSVAKNQRGDLEVNCFPPWGGLRTSLPYRSIQGCFAGPLNRFVACHGVSAFRVYHRKKHHEMSNASNAGGTVTSVLSYIYNIYIMSMLDIGLRSCDDRQAELVTSGLPLSNWDQFSVYIYIYTPYLICFSKVFCFPTSSPRPVLSWSLRSSEL